MAANTDLLTSITQRLSEGHTFTLDECCHCIAQLYRRRQAYRLSVLHALLDSGSLDVTNLDGDSQMRLFRACVSVSVDERDSDEFESTMALLSELFDNGFSMDKAWPFQELLSAGFTGRTSICRHVPPTLAEFLLVRGKVDPNLYHNGITPFMAQTCISYNASSPQKCSADVRVMDLLIEHGADINLPDRLTHSRADESCLVTLERKRIFRGLTPLQLLCANPTCDHPLLWWRIPLEKHSPPVSQDDCRVVNALIKRFITVYKADTKGVFALAVERGSLPLLELLLECATAGRERIITNAHALSTMEQHAFPEMCENIKRGSVSTIRGSLLHFAVVTASHRQGAVGRGTRACVSFIAESVADINALDSQGMPAVFYAAASDDANTLMRLLKMGAEPIDIKEEKYAKSGASFTNEIQAIMYCEDDEEWDQLWAKHVGGDDDDDNDEDNV